MIQFSKKPRQQLMDQTFAILRDSKWIIIACIVLSFALYLPDQTRELYRIAHANGIAAILAFFWPVLLIAIIFWIGASQLVIESGKQRGHDPDTEKIVARLLPSILGGAILVACGA